MNETVQQEQEVAESDSGIGQTLSEYGSATGTFVMFAWLGDLPLKVVAAVVAFVFVAIVASALFNRLAGIVRPPRQLPKWIVGLQAGLQAAAFGAVLGVAGVSGQEYIDDIGIGSAALAGLIVSLVAAAWRQRWHERRPHRKMLSAAPAET